MTAKIARVEGTCFKSCPMFKDLDKLPNDDQVRWSGGRMSISTFNEEVDDLQEDAEELKKKKKQKKAPSITEMRSEMKKMIFFYEKSVAASIPTVYPLLGAVGEHMDDKEKNGGKTKAKSGLKRKH